MPPLDMAYWSTSLTVKHVVASRKIISRVYEVACQLFDPTLLYGKILINLINEVAGNTGAS